jgi:molybdenum cofactor biosynthesis protein MoaC
MKDITAKIETKRHAVAETRVTGDTELLEQIWQGEQVDKGDPLEVARIAAIQGAKQTPDILPFCHPIPITNTGVEYDFDDGVLSATVEVTTLASTGVEMEALSAASICSLTLYDMLKPHTDELLIEQTRLVSKSGGSSDFQPSFEPPLKGDILVVSDSVAAGDKEDSAGKAVQRKLDELSATEVTGYSVLPDEPEQIRDYVQNSIDGETDIVITVGGTGLSPRDRTVKAVSPILDRKVPGIMEAVRAYGQQRTPYAMLSRGVAGTANETLVLTFPGSTSGASESFDAIFPAILHVFHVLRMEPHDKGYEG